MKYATYYRTYASYNAGILWTKWEAETDTEAKAKEQDYIARFPDCNKELYTYKVTERSALWGLFRKVVTVEYVRSWHEKDGWAED